MKDKLTNGFIQGLIAGVVSNIADFIMVSWLKFGELLYLDYAGVHVYGFKPELLGEKLFALAIQLTFSGLTGILFVYWIDKVKTRNILIKGMIFGVAVWFITYTITILFKLKPLDKVSLASAIENYIVALIFGVAIVIAYNWLGKKIEE